MFFNTKQRETAKKMRVYTTSFQQTLNLLERDIADLGPDTLEATKEYLATDLVQLRTIHTKFSDLMEGM